MFWIYIIYSQRLDRYYVGYSLDLEQRVADHNRGKNTYTKKGIPWDLKHEEKFASKEEAMKRDRYIKAQKSRIYIENLVRAK